MDKTTGRAKLLTEMGQPPIFDCGVLCDRAFRIDLEHIDIAGYGRDRSGSARYLKDTLNVVQETNNNEECLIPIHADGDGHCLVHAISRALVGRELFYYPLRLNLMCHLRDNLERYKELFKNFVDVDEWEDIISECHPNFIPKEGELAGLRNIHIFGLANVLKRPIILLDNPKGIESSGDYSGELSVVRVISIVCSFQISFIESSGDYLGELSMVSVTNIICSFEISFTESSGDYLGELSMVSVNTVISIIYVLLRLALIAFGCQCSQTPLSFS